MGRRRGRALTQGVRAGSGIVRGHVLVVVVEVDHTAATRLYVVLDIDSSHRVLLRMHSAVRLAIRLERGDSPDTRGVSIS